MCADMYVGMCIEMCVEMCASICLHGHVNQAFVVLLPVLCIVARH